MDEQIQRGKKWLETLLSLMGVSPQVSVGRVEKNDQDVISCWLTIDETSLTPATLEALIGKKGENIDAMQYLANVLLNIATAQGSERFYTVELNGYRIRRQAELMAIAQKAADRVRITGMPEEIRYLSSVERRQVHSYLERAGDLATESQGNEPDRRLIVKLKH